MTILVNVVLSWFEQNVIAASGGLLALFLLASNAYHNWYVRRQLRFIANNTGVHRK